ncbi:unnamed protein product [Anisakis simplex]|uniref:Aldehyde dehydrogenase n=1 Tax=Anisakis simplex TaxID=6269 RepID=A0A0M3K2T2_ANISI|nr:unnamed protein product [Anisakis simplex]
MAYQEIVSKQREYFMSGETMKVEYRKKQLKFLKLMIEHEMEVFEQAIFEDLRRAPKLSYNLELSTALAEISYMLDNLDEWCRPQKTEKTFVTMLDTPMIVKEPLGVVLIISPWNYPVLLILHPLIAAIAAGNTVVIKPSEISAHTSKAVADLISNYFDPQYITVVEGGIDETSELLKEQFDYIFYTGCTSVGKVIMSAASQHLTPVTLELGGKSPVVVDDNVDLEVCARRISWGKWMNCGQTCIAPDYILTTDAMKMPLLKAFEKVLGEFYGSKIQQNSDYSRIINERHFDRLKKLLDESKSIVLHKNGELDRNDLFIPPIILDSNGDDIIMQDEIFGPILPIVTVDDFDGAIKFIRSHPKPLAAYFFSKAKRNIDRFINEVSCGGITINDVFMHITVDTLPFGGVGPSGMGRYHGKFGFDSFTHEKAVLKKSFFGESLLASRYPPYTDEKFALMTSLTKQRRSIPKFIRRYVPMLSYVALGFLIGFVVEVFHALHYQSYVSSRRALTATGACSTGVTT